MTLGAVDLILKASLLANRSRGLCGDKSQTTAMVGGGQCIPLAVVKSWATIIAAVLMCGSITALMTYTSSVE
jgi:hypothetical protein